MRFLYHPEAGLTSLTLSGEPFLHLKARRVREGETLYLRNLQNDFLYEYRLDAFDRRDARLSLASAKEEPVLPARKTRLAWCIVDPKIVEKALPFLNELGVGELILLWCEKSQRSFRMDFERMERIAVASCEQCGRSRPIVLSVCECADFLRENPDAALLDFGGEPLSAAALGERTLIVGPEGGFGPADYERFKTLPRYGVASPLVLRSETALLLAAGALLL